VSIEASIGGERSDGKKDRRNLTYGIINKIMFDADGN